VQHAWAEIEHDIQYKAVETIPTSIRRRFMALSELLEIADREFQAISDDDEHGRTDARHLLAAGQLDRVEITPDVLKAYLDSKYMPDGRMADWSYAWATRLLKRLGFENFGQVDDAIGGYDDDRISRLLWGGRRGQLSRFEDVLLAAMGEDFITRHPWSSAEPSWGWPNRRRNHLERLAAAGIPIGSYSIIP
jgi:hypothetical protein